MPMWLDSWGFVSVAAMARAYSLERRVSTAVVIFAVASASASGYAVAIGSWHFATVEAVWAAIALRRWWSRRREEALSDG
jgi:uncharacterized membrane protein